MPENLSNHIVGRLQFSVMRGGSRTHLRHWRHHFNPKSGGIKLFAALKLPRIHRGTLFETSPTTFGSASGGTAKFFKPTQKQLSDVGVSSRCCRRRDCCAAGQSKYRQSPLLRIRLCRTNFCECLRVCLRGISKC